MKRTISAALAGALLLALASGCSESAPSGESVTVEAVSTIVGGGSLGLADWYAGKVVSGETADVKRDSTKAILETYVEVGDMVEAGDVLFAYDTEKMQLDLDKMLLEKENLENGINNANATIEDLERQKAKAKEDEQLSYTLQIDGKKAEIRESEYNIALAERDIAAMEASLENAEITSPIAGRVMSVEDTESSGSYYGYGYDDGSSSGNDVKYITVTDVTRLRIQGNINEMNAGALMEGMAMTVRSRTDAGKTWKGSLSMIDWENPVGRNDDDSVGAVYYSGDSSDEMTSSSKYPFYVELEDTEGLILGQHVYIEPDNGEDEESAPAGPMLPSYYLVQEEDGAYVWAADSKDRLEKRSVTLGAYDENTDCYEIAEGLTEEDYIAFPQEDLTEGMAAEKYDPAAAAEAASEEGQVSAEMPAMGG